MINNKKYLHNFSDVTGRSFVVPLVGNHGVLHLVPGLQAAGWAAQFRRVEQQLLAVLTVRIYDEPVCSWTQNYTKLHIAQEQVSRILKGGKLVVTFDSFDCTAFLLTDGHNVSGAILQIQLEGHCITVTE